VAGVVSEQLELPEWDEKELRPKSKMPNCPRCGEDELGMMHAELTICYACGFKIGWWISVIKLLAGASVDVVARGDG